MTYEQLKLDNQLCFRLYTAARLIVQAYDPYLRPLGITYTQYIALLVLWEKDGLPVNDIGKRLLLGINTTSPLIKRMEKLDLVYRMDGETDKRQQIVFLTEKGKAMKEQAASIPNCMVKGFGVCDLDVEKVLSLNPLLDEFIEKMSKKDNQSAAK